jgi:hypothetical protein
MPLTVSDHLAILQDKVDLVAKKAAVGDEVRYLKAKFDLAEMKRAEEAERAQARSQAMSDAQANADTRARYQPVFEQYGEQPPAPVAGDAPEAYRRHMMRLVRDKLSGWDERPINSYGAPVSSMAMMSGIDRRLSGQALDNIEDTMLQAAKVQADVPHVSTLPENGDQVSRRRVDAAGKVSTEWFGRESFIKRMSTPGRKVWRILNPATGQVLWGEPFSRDPRK